ncbi:MAG: hypothetical protein V8S08_03525 [Lachnoclostridium sp.]
MSRTVFRLAAIEVEDDQAIIRAKSTIAYTGIGMGDYTVHGIDGYRWQCGCRRWKSA